MYASVADLRAEGVTAAEASDARLELLLAEASSASGAIERRTRSIVARRIAGGVRPVSVPSSSVKPQSPSAATLPCPRGNTRP